MAEREPIRFDPSDPEGMEALMDQYGDSQSPFSGTNELGEDVVISIFRSKIVVMTYQKNGWLRKNVYDRDGTREELYEGKWTEPVERDPEPSDPKAAYHKGFKAGFQEGCQAARQKKPKRSFNHRQTME